MCKGHGGVHGARTCCVAYHTVHIRLDQILDAVICGDLFYFYFYSAIDLLITNRECMAVPTNGGLCHGVG